MINKQILILQRSIATLFILFAVVAILFNIFAPSGPNFLINVITVSILTILFSLTYINNAKIRILQVFLLMGAGCGAIIFATEINFVGVGILIATILLLYAYNILKSYSIPQLVIICFIFLIIQIGASLISPVELDFFYIISTIFSLMILITTLIIFKDNIQKYIDILESNQIYLTTGQITATLLHNIQLDTALGFNHFALKALKSGNIDEAISILETQRENLSEIERIRRNIFTGIQINVSKKVYKKQNLKKILTSVIEFVEQDEELSLDVTIKNNIPDLFIRVIGVDIFLLLQSLITNSLEALQNREQPEKSIEISATTTAKEALIAIVDNGGGFKTTRIDDLTSSKELGGVGLLLVREALLNRYKSDIELFNTEDGAKVVIRLPLAE